MKNPVVSIIVPVYNTEKYLSRCLDSILAQTYSEWEAILIDDGSTDDSGRICDVFAEKDKRIKVIHQKNAGVSAARFAALNISQGNYVTFIDSDDYVSEIYLEKLLISLQTEGVDFTCCQNTDIFRGEKRQQNRPIKGMLEGQALKQTLSKNLFYEPTTRISGMPLYLCGKMFKKGLLEEGLKAALNTWYGEDQLAVLTILYNSNAIHILPESLYNYVHYDEQVTSKYRADKWDEFYSLWIKLLDVDKEHLIERQMPYRMWNSSIYFYYDSIGHFSTYDEYEKLTRHIFESDLLRKYVFGGFVKNIPQGKFEKAVFFLLKYKLYRLLYLEIKRIRKSINHG